MRPRQGHGFLPPQPVLLELHRGQVAQRRVDPLPIELVVQEPTELGVSIGVVTVLGQVDLLLSDRPHQAFGESVLLRLADGRHAGRHAASGRRSVYAVAAYCIPWSECWISGRRLLRIARFRPAKESP